MKIIITSCLLAFSLLCKAQDAKREPLNTQPYPGQVKMIEPVKTREPLNTQPYPGQQPLVENKRAPLNTQPYPGQTKMGEEKKLQSPSNPDKKNVVQPSNEMKLAPNNNSATPSPTNQSLKTTSSNPSSVKTSEYKNDGSATPQQLHKSTNLNTNSSKGNIEKSTNASPTPMKK